MRNHITQEAFIKKIVGNNGFWLLLNDPYVGYRWVYSKNYKHPILTYNQGRDKDILCKFDPEINGHGTNNYFSKIERNIHNTFNKLNNNSQTCPLQIPEVNKIILTGLQFIARFSGQKVLEDYGLLNSNGDNFDRIMSILTKHSEILIKSYPNDDNWKELWDNAINYNNEFNEYVNQHYNGKLILTDIIFPENDAILSDSSILYSHSQMMYPTTSNQLISLRIQNDITDKFLERIIESSFNWIDYVCRYSKLYLIAHESFSKETREAILELFKTKQFGGLIQLQKDS